MSMKQNIEIDGKQVPFRASAAIPLSLIHI